MTEDELQTIADNIASYSDGAFHIAWDEEFEALDKADQETVRNAVFEQVDSCGLCGRHFMIDSMEHDEDTGENYCWHCQQDIEEDEEEE